MLPVKSCGVRSRPKVRAAARAMTGRCANSCPAIRRHQPDASRKPVGPVPSWQSAVARRRSAKVILSSKTWNSSRFIVAFLTASGASPISDHAGKPLKHFLPADLSSRSACLPRGWETSKPECSKKARVPEGCGGTFPTCRYVAFIGIWPVFDAPLRQVKNVPPQLTTPASGGSTVVPTPSRAGAFPRRTNAAIRVGTGPSLP